MNLTRRQMLQMGAAAFGIAKLPVAKPTWEQAIAAAQRSMIEEGKWKGILAGIDLSQGPDRTCITFGRWNADGTLTITGHELL